jgi:hypothetical protein
VVSNGHTVSVNRIHLLWRRLGGVEIALQPSMLPWEIQGGEHVIYFIDVETPWLSGSGHSFSSSTKIFRGEMPIHPDQILKHEVLLDECTG